MAHAHQFRHRHPRHEPAMDNEDMLEERQLFREANPGTSSSDDSGTVLSVVYVTASPTFTGAIGGYTTLNAGDPVQASSPSSQQEPSAAPSATASSEDGTFETITGLVTPPSSSSQPPTSTVQPSTPSSRAVLSTPSSSQASSRVSSISSLVVLPSTTLLTASLTSSQYSSAALAGAEATASQTASPSSSATSSGLSAAAKTGLAIGILLAVALLVAGALFLYSKKRKEGDESEKQDNEKNGFAALRDEPAPKLTAAAPFLDLRPMSRLMPERLSQGNPLAMFGVKSAAPPAGAARGPSPQQNASAWGGRAVAMNEKAENPFQDPQNPFGDEHAHAVSTASGAVPAPGPNVPAPLKIRSPTKDEFAAGAAVVGAGAAVAVAGAAAAGAAAPSHNGPTSPESTRSTAMSDAAAAAGTIPGGPQNNVHRVQLDFKPSMDDEIELRNGQLVRILHEYDDGWALCMRLDRSQQGVAPRTCLSPKPIKPRPMNNGARRPGRPDPRGPPRLGPNGRPMTPNGGPGPRSMSPMGPPGSRPMTPKGTRPMSPHGGPPSRPMTPNGGPGPRPMSPGMARPMSPGMGHRFNGPPPMSPDGGRGRSNSAAAASRPMNPSNGAPYNQTPRPLSPGPVARSPRPGQTPRSMSPGPYVAGKPPGKMVAQNQRRRSNSASALDVRERRLSPPGPSPLGGAPAPGWVPPRRPVGGDAM